MERRRRRLEPEPARPRRRDRPRERWLLTRKTWKYMSDAGRRLVPEGAHNRAEDVPRIEAYFQEVCQREPRFLLWRKSSYPGALPRPKRSKRRGGSVRARSPDEPAPPSRPTDLYIGTSGGRFDIAKLRRDFFATPAPLISSGPKYLPKTTPVEEEENVLVDLLRTYLKIEDDRGPSRVAESEELVRSLKRFLKRQADQVPTDGDAEPGQRNLLDNLGRYYGRASNRDSIVQDLLTDRSLLKRLYHDLRKTRPYRGVGGRGGGGSGASGSGYVPISFSSSSSRSMSRVRPVGPDDDDAFRSPPLSPPPLIEVFSESLEYINNHVDCGTQTVPIPEPVLCELERAYREKLEALAAATEPNSPTSPPPGRQQPGRRRSSVDHDDVSQSVSDTIKRYLRMARKKSVDADKADRFKRINYDKNLRNIKPRAPGEVDDDGPHKGCQTEEGWILTYRELRFASVASTPTSPPASPLSPSHSQSFLSTLLGRGSSSPTATGGMQKSRSSSSVVQSLNKRLWRTRSRSSSRQAATWTPQGSCVWTDGSGRCVKLTDTSLLTLSEIERRALQQAALTRLQQLNLGTSVKIPEESAVVLPKPKRRAYLLKRKALTTGFFDQRVKDDKDKESPNSIFGVPLSQCVETERALRRQQHGGSRASLASLTGIEKGDDSESCDSNDWWSGLEEAGGGGPRVPALVSACLAHLRRHGLNTIGLFRVSPSKKRVRQLREEWERGQEAALDGAACPHDVATLLKEFLRDLPDPLLCRDLYQAFLQTQKIRNRTLQWEALKLLVQLLPAAHRDTLNALLSFLAELANHSDDGNDTGNKMDAANLATIFAPNILHRNKANEPASADQLSERSDVINVVRQLVERQAELWTLKADLLHEAYIHLAHTSPAHLDSLLPKKAETASPETVCAADAAARRVWSREQFLHGAAATARPEAPRRSEKSYSRSRRTREPAPSDTSSGSLSSAMTIVTRVRNSDELREGGVGVWGAGGRDSAADSNDSASDYNETLGSDSDCVITASLHIPARAPPPPPRHRTDVDDKRDSAVGSSSNASSPPASPPPAPLRVTVTSTGELHSRELHGSRELSSRELPGSREVSSRELPGSLELRRGERVRETRRVEPNIDIDRLINLGRERNTSDARAVVLRQHDDSAVRTRASTKQETYKTERREEKREEKRGEKEGTTLYKRGELISSARPHT